VLTVAALLWTGIAGPQADGDDAVEHLVLIDASAGMAVGDRFARAQELAAEAVASLPRNSTTVRLCGAMPQTVLLPGESAHLLERRLASARPDASPSTIQRELIALPTDAERRVHALVIGGAPIDETARTLLERRVDVERIACVPESAPKNRGITALAVTEASSGHYDRCDLFIEARGTNLGAVTVARDGHAATRLEPVATESGAIYELADVATDGAMLVATLDGDDDLPLDDSARLRLPERRVFRVQVAADASPALRLALASDPAVEIVDDNADVIVRAAAGTPAALPALEYAEAATTEHAFLVRDTAGTGSTDDLAALLPRLGLDAIDAMELAAQAERPISIGGEIAERRSVQVWEELLTERYDFTRSRAFPLFVASALRWLAGEGELHAWLAAGESAAFSGAAVDDRGRVHDPVGARFTPPRAGDYTWAGATFAASLLDPATVAVAGGSVEPPPVELPGAPLDWPLFLAIAALLLLCVEWFLYRNGRMP